MRSRSRPLWRVVAPVLVGTALVSMLVIAAANYVVTADLDREQSLEQLGELQRSRAQAITAGLEHRRQTVAMLASDRSVVTALLELRDGFEALDRIDEPLSAGQTAELTARAERLTSDDALRSLVVAAGLDVPTVEQLVPDDPAARYVQFHYGDGDRAQRLALDDAGDGSDYSAAHARHHRVLRELAVGAGFSDLMIVSLDGRVVYTAAKGPDLGVHAVDSIFGAGRPGSGGLAGVLADDLPRASAGEAVLVDVQPYLGTAGRPVMFMAAAVSDDREIVGAVVAQLPIDRLNRLMTADRQWIDAGLGDTGQTYVVGRDLLMRSDHRSYLEDAEGHLAALRSDGLDHVATVVAAAGSTVLAQPVDSDAVRTALDGRTFSGRSAGGGGFSDRFSVASPLGVAGLDWVVVAEIDRNEATVETSRQLSRLVMLALGLLSAVAVVGLLLARHLTRPVTPLVAAAERVAAGEHTIDLDDPSHDEYGHLARELRTYAAALQTEDTALDRERRALDELLLAVLPARAIDAVRSGTLERGDLVDTATVVAVTLDGLPESHDADWVQEQSGAIAAALEAVAERHRVERVWSSADRHLYVAGLGRADHGCDEAVSFINEARGALAQQTNDIDVSMHAGLAAGTVATGLVGGDQLAFGLWGEPTRLALALDAVGGPGEVLLHESVSTRLTAVIAFDPVTVDLGGGDVQVHRLSSPSALTPPAPATAIDHAG